MNNIAVITDTNTCLPQEILQEYRIGIVPILIVFGDEVLRSGIDITPEEFYVRLRSADPLPTTSSPTPSQYQEAFEAARAAGAEGIVALCLSSKLSMAYSSACAAADAMGRFPVRVIDSRLAASAQGFVALAAARAAARGMDLDGVVEAAQSSIEGSGFMAVLDTMSYLLRGGRLSEIASSLAGSVLKVHPVLGSHNDGTLGIIALTRTKKAGIDRMLREIEGYVAGHRLFSLAVMHADAEDEADELREIVSARFECEELYTVEFTPVMGAHSGPGVVGLAYRTVEQGTQEHEGET